MPDQADVTDKGGTMRLGLYPARLEEGSKVRAAYGTEIAYERHRHRFEVNNAYRDRLDAAGMAFSGVSPDGRLVEYIELRDHPWFVATQAHPELKSRPNRPHPLFRDFVGAAAGELRRCAGGRHAGRRGERADRQPATAESGASTTARRRTPAPAPSAESQRAGPRHRRRRAQHDRHLARRAHPLRRSSRSGSPASTIASARELLYAAYVEALEALNPLYAAAPRAAWRRARATTDLPWRPRRDRSGGAARRPERLDVHVETPYYAALRRYLALIGIEQGDASEADLWHVLRGSSWAHWFGERETARRARGNVPHGATCPSRAPGRLARRRGTA